MNNFLESSSIHGLNYISTTRKCVKLFWILVVFTGFTGAAILVHQSFQSWEESPVSTTIETRPIPEITFPKALATLVGELWYSRDWWPFRPSGGRLAVANT